MNCLTEAIGMALPGNGSIPAVMSERISLAKRAGERVMELLAQEVAAVNARVAAHENLKKCHFVFDEWTPDNGMLSQTLKPKRRNLVKRYAEVIKETYKNG